MTLEQLSGVQPRQVVVHAFLNKVMTRFPHRFEVDLLQEFYSFFALSLPAFRALRSNKHLSCMILTQYRMRSHVKQELLVTPEKRHVVLRYFPTLLNAAFGKKSTLGIMLTLSLADRFERFDEEHLLSAIQKWIADARLVTGSRYIYQHPEEENVLTLYVEFDKQQGTFSLKERRLLKKILLQEIRDHVQKLQPHVHSICNEENVMKNIIHLSHEIQDPNSIPQMMIFFETQTRHALTFTVVIVYLVNQVFSIDDLLNSYDPSVTLYLERHETVGYLECQTPKKTLVFRTTVKKMPDLRRRDFSLDAYSARKKVHAAVCHAIGEVRDCNGGLMQKQEELFVRLQQRFIKHAHDRTYLLGLFFFGLKPIERQATLSIDVLETLFSLLVDSFQTDFSQQGAHFIRFFEDQNNFYGCVRTEGVIFKKHLTTNLNNTFFSSPFATTSLFSFQDTFCAVFLLKTTDDHIRQQLKDSLDAALTDWKKEQEEFQLLRLNFIDRPFSLDPRMGGHEMSKVILQLLFEGLMRLSEEGPPEYALAESVEQSDNAKVYTFKIKKTFWSNGMLLKASDFAYAWKKILSPDFETPFAQVFYCIKNARLVKQGLLPLESVGIYVIDISTLKVELEYPVSYFLELLMHPLFTPIHEQTDIVSPQWSISDGKAFVCNGPFCLLKNQGDKGYILEKNPYYWDTKNITLNRVVFSKTNTPTAFEKFKLGKLDWIGRPMRYLEQLSTLAKIDNSEFVALKERVILCMFNTKCFPLSSIKLRQALALAIDRQEFIAVFDIGQPAFSPLHSYHTFFPAMGHRTGEIVYAQRLFQKALEELNIKPSNFPTLILNHHDSEVWARLATILKKQWKQFLGVDIVTRPHSSYVVVENASRGEYMLALMNWFSWVNDPLYTLNAFKFPEAGVNFPKWESAEFQKILNLADQEQDIKIRASLLARAEATLIKESPLIPIMYEKEIALKKTNLHVPISMGYVDFKKAKIIKGVTDVRVSY